MDDLFEDDPFETEGLARVGDQAARIADLIERRLAPALERIATALEKASIPLAPAPAPTPAPVAEPAENGPTIPRVVVPEPPPTTLSPEELRLRIDVARGAGDAAAVLESRDALAGLLDPGEIVPLDRDLARWVMMRLMKRMRGGSVDQDMAILAARASESFAHLPEGASLRGALPTLRRSVNLCARCAEPYMGNEDVCDRCRTETPKIADLPLPATPAT